MMSPELPCGGPACGPHNPPQPPTGRGGTGCAPCDRIRSNIGLLFLLGMVAVVVLLLFFGGI